MCGSSEAPERLTERAIRRISPISALLIMPAFALANTAVCITGGAVATGAVVSAAGSGAAAVGAINNNIRKFQLRVC